MGTRIISKIFSFTVFSFTFRYFFEQYFKLLMTLVIEILHISNAIKEVEHSEEEEKKRMLSYFLKYKIAVAVSAFLFFIMAVLLFLTIYKGIMNIKKLKTNPK